MNNENSFCLAQKLNQLMKEQNLTVTSASRLINMNKSTLHNYCNGVVPRNLMKLQELAGLLGVSLSELVLGAQYQLSSGSLAETQEEKFEVIIKRVR